MQFSKVDLPQPDDPSRDEEFAIIDVDIQILQNVNGFKGKVEVLHVYGMHLLSLSLRRSRCRAHKQFAGYEIDNKRHQPRQDRGSHVHIIFLLAKGRVDDVIQLHGHRIGSGRV